MKSKAICISLAAIAISALIVGIVVSASSSDPLEKREVSDQEQAVNNESVVIDEMLKRIYGDNATLVIASEDELLGEYEKSDRLFEKVERRNKIIYWYQRMIDGAKVEGDRRNYQFNRTTKELIRKDVHWCDDLPEHLPPIIPKEEAESMVGGAIRSELYIISPESHAFPIKPAPKNPCWVVRRIDGNGYINITIVDAVEGKILGYGVPPPSGGLSFSGPQDAPNCTGVWTDRYLNAESWFESMGYFPTEARIYPNDDVIREHIQSYETVMFYGVAHSIGDSSSVIRNDCSGTMTADEIHDWIENYPKMPFTFLVSCNAMCDTGLGTLSYEFRKGSMEDTVTVGCCGMSEPECDACWDVMVAWQDALFNNMNQGWTVKAAFDQACDDYLMCEPCVRFTGDPNFKVVPLLVLIAESDHKYNNVAVAYDGPAHLNGSKSYGNNVMEYKWNFGDGEVGYGKKVEHRYETYNWAGDETGHYEPFTASLTVKYNEGETGTSYTDVNVYIAGDANGDGEVSVLDASMTGLRFNKACANYPGVCWGNEDIADKADLNNDCVVNILDTSIVGLYWAHTAW